MRPTLHPALVNGRFGDPALFVQALHRPEALLFDLGDLTPLSARDLLRVRHVFVSHMHMDHFIGFDQLLRVNIGRDKQISMVGPAGFAAAVGHKLQAYSWDLVDRYATDLIIDAFEVIRPDEIHGVRYRFKSAFVDEGLAAPAFDPGPVIRWPDFLLHVAILEHHGPSLGFAVEEPLHVNVWKNRLDACGLTPGNWLQTLKRAIQDNAPDDTSIPIAGGSSRPLGELRDLISIERGQKIAYVTDVGDTAANRSAIQALANDADTFFIEASFSAADRQQAAQRAHLTTTAAGEIARSANARRVEPFHFSPRYQGQEEQMMEEVRRAFNQEQEPAKAGS